MDGNKSKINALKLLRGLSREFACALGPGLLLRGRNRWASREWSLRHIAGEAEICYDFEVSKNEMGGSAHFLFVKPISDREGWLRDTLSGLGYELVDVEMSRSGLMRVFIDKPQGINVEDCAAVSHHLTRLFAVEDVAYERLEVSSPGLDRPLKRVEDFARFTGQVVSVRLKFPIDGQRRFEGRIAGLEGGRVVIEIEGKRRELAFEDIDRARLVPQL